MQFENKVCFFRIPKNASTSIYEHLGDKNIIRDENLKKLFKKNRFHNIFAPSHCKVSEAIECIGQEILLLPCFAVCRNPFDRMVSQYFFCQQNDFINKTFTSFNNFVDFCLKEKSIASMSQSEYLDIPSKVSILKFENLQEDFKNFLFNYNVIDIPVNLPQKNKSSHNKYQNYYTKETEKKVLDLWHEDFQRFNYSTNVQG